MRTSNLGGLGLGALLLSGCVAPPAPPPGPANARGSKPAPSIAIEGVRRVEQRTIAAPIHGRDPFGFATPSASRPGSRALPPLPPTEGLPELPLPVPRPAVRLLG